MDKEDSNINLCRVCKKSIGSGREGSLTQFIFRAEQCKCASPQPLRINSNKPRVRVSSVKKHTVDKPKEIQVDPDRFPLERYLPLAELGSGTAGIVYECVDRLLNKKVAVKTLHRLTPEQLIAFQEEARCTSHIKHPNVITILDFGANASGTPYMVMEYVPSCTLRAYIREFGPLDLLSAVVVTVKTLEALAYLHENHIYHRDIQPCNILLCEDNDQSIDIRLIDFSIAGVTEPTGAITDVHGKTLAGTPPYMAPDTVRGLTYDHRSELYSVGCVLFEMITGQPPFIGSTPLETLSRHVESAVPSIRERSPIELPDQFVDLVARCLAKDPRERYQTLDEPISILKKLQDNNSDARLLSDQQPSPTQALPIERTAKKKLFVLLLLMCISVAVASRLWLVKTDRQAPTNTRKKLKPRSSPVTWNADDVIDKVITEENPAINLAYTDLRPGLLRRLKGFHVSVLNLTFADLSEETLSELKDVGVRKLILTHTGCDSLQGLQEMKFLEVLDLSNSEYSEQAIDSIPSNITGLALLDLSRTRISLACVVRLLKRIPSIQSLNLDKCPRISDADQAELTRRFPLTGIGSTPSIALGLRTHVNELSLRGDLKAAYNESLKLVRMIDAAYPTPPTSSVNILAQFAQLASQAGKQKEAKLAAHRAFKLVHDSKDQLIKCHWHDATARALESARMYDKAEAEVKMCHYIRNDIFGANSIETAETRLHWALLCTMLDKAKKAEELLVEDRHRKRDTVIGREPEAVVHLDESRVEYAKAILKLEQPTLANFLLLTALEPNGTESGTRFKRRAANLANIHIELSRTCYSTSKYQEALSWLDKVDRSACLPPVLAEVDALRRQIMKSIDELNR